MPRCPEFTLPPLAPLSPWTVAFAQVALGIAARSIASAADLLGRVHAGLPEPPDLADRQEGRKPYDQATDILATIECVLEDDLLCRARHKRSSSKTHSIVARMSVTTT